MNIKAYQLIKDARDVYFNKMTGKPKDQLPDFEDYVFAICQEARELRKTGNYMHNSVLPVDRTLHDWRYALSRTMTQS